MTIREETVKEKALPKGWREVRLGEVGDFSKGNGITKNELVSNGVPCIRYGELYTRHNLKVKDFYSFVENKDLDKYKCIKNNSLLFAGSGETREEIGKCASFNHDVKVYAGGDVIIFSIDPTKLHAEFASYYLNTKGRKQINRLGQGDSIVHIYSRFLQTVKIPCPPILEQKAIASLLEKWDIAIEKTEALIAAKQKQFKWLRRILTKSKNNWGKSTIGNHFEQSTDSTVSAERDIWPMVKLKEVLNYEQPSNYVAQSTQYDNAYKTPVLTAGKSFLLGYTNDSTGIFPREKLPVIIFDDFTTASKFVDFPFKVRSSAMKILTPQKGVEIKFIFYMMECIKFSVHAHKRYWISEYSDLLISLPSLPEQKAIVSLLEKAEKEINLLRTLANEYHEQKRGLMQKLLTGRWKLING